MKEPENFYNDGFGWLCRRCERTIEAPTDAASHSRLLREGESESKSPRLSNFALAKWADKSRTTLVCPRCGITEKISTTETQRHRE
jgi:hypothetical protein